MPDSNTLLLREVDYLLFAARKMRIGSITLDFVYNHRSGSTHDFKELAAVFVIHGGRRVQVPLAQSLRRVMDFLGSNPHRYYDAAQLATGLRHIAVAHRREGRNGRPIHRTSVRVHVGRIRSALGTAFAKAKVRVDPKQVLKSEKLATNAVGYSLAARIKIVDELDYGEERKVSI